MKKFHGFETISQYDSHSDEAYIRIAVSNFVWKTNGELIGILSRSLGENGEKKLGLIGGGAYLLHDKQDMRMKGAVDFEGRDARFKIPLSKLDQFIDKDTGDVLFLCEQDMTRELYEELNQELIHGMKEPILTEDELQHLRPQYIGMFNEFEGLSRESIQRGTNFRVINIFNLTAPDAIVAKIKNAKVTYSISSEDIASGVLQSDPNITLKPFLTQAAHFVEQEEKRRQEDEYDFDY